MMTLGPLSLSALDHGAFVAAGLLTYVMVTRIGQQRRHPSAAMAWVISIAAFPYVAVPLFLLFGTRKFARPAPAVDRPNHGPHTGDAPQWASRLLGGMGFSAPLRNGPIEFHEDGPASCRGLLALLDGAQDSLEVCTYVLRDDSVGRGVADALMAAVVRGVKVRLLVDWVGNLATGRRLLNRLRAGGVELRQFMPLLHNPRHGRTNLRNHRKLVVADGRRLWSGGRNLAAEYFHEQAGHPAWLDLSFVIEGPVAAQAAAQFDRDWHVATGLVREPTVVRPSPLQAPTGGPAQWISSGPDQAEDTVHALLMAGAYNARRRMLAVTPYFVPDDALLDAWCTACRCGVDITLVVPAASNHRLADWARARALRRLAEAGAHVYLSPVMVHAKAVVIDDDFALCGSVNLDGRSLFLNYEAMTAFYGATEVRWLANWIEGQTKLSRAFVAERPSWWRELVEGVILAVGFQL